MSTSGCSVSVQQQQNPINHDPPPLINCSLKVLNNKFYNSSSYQGILSFSNLYLSGGLEVNKNDLIRNSCGHGIQLTNVQAWQREAWRNFIKENLIQECAQGHGICIERSTCMVENCEVIKCEGNGIHGVMN